MAGYWNLALIYSFCNTRANRTAPLLQLIFVKKNDLVYNYIIKIILFYEALHMDNIFAYLGQLGSQNSLLNKNHRLDELFKDTEQVSFTDFIKKEHVGVAYRSTVECCALADTALKQFRKYYGDPLGNAGTFVSDPLLEAFVVLESFTKDLFLSHHNETEKTDILRLIRLSAEHMLESPEIGRLREKLIKIVRDPLSEYTLDDRTAPAKLMDLINKNPATLFCSRPVLAEEINPFINDYFSEKNIRAEMTTIEKTFAECTGASAEGFPGILSRLQSLLKNFAHTENENNDCLEKFSRFSGALLSHESTMPDAETVSNYKERRLFSLLRDDFNKSIKPALEKELTFLMIASFEYTNSLYRLKIRNGGHSTGLAEYIAAFDNEKRFVKKLIEYSSIKFNESGQGNYIESFVLGSIVRKNQKTAWTVLPHFIRRIYDTGVTEGKTSERDPLAHSIYDVGPVLGLVGVSTVRKNPYLLPLNAGKSQMDGASPTAFLNSFSSVPFSTNAAKSVLDNCKAEAKKERTRKRIDDSSAFLDTVTPEKLAIMEQFMTERFSNTCFLSKAYKLSTMAPYMWNPGKNLQMLERYPHLNGLGYCFDYYLDPVIEKLMVLPLPVVRLQIINYLEKFLAGNTGQPQLDSELKQLSPARILRCLETFTKYLERLVTFWTETTVPWHVLYYHYLAAGCRKADKSVTFLSDDFFQGKECTRYNFYYKNEKGKIDILPSLCAETNLQYLKYPDDVVTPFNRYSQRFYNSFLEQTYRMVYSGKRPVVFLNIGPASPSVLKF